MTGSNPVTRGAEKCDSPGQELITEYSYSSSVCAIPDDKSKKAAAQQPSSDGAGGVGRWAYQIKSFSEQSTAARGISPARAHFPSPFGSFW